jgi:trehalose synthase
VFEVDLAVRRIEPFAELVEPARLAALEQTAHEITALLGGRRVWNVNSTAAGGGVAEMLRSLLRYSRGLGIDARWLVLDGPPEFFRITKRIHNALHGDAGDGSPLGDAEAALYEQVSAANAAELDGFVRRNDVVLCHDPQTAGLVPHLVERGAIVVWRCHIGHESWGGELERGWAFLRKYVEVAPVVVFTRWAYAPRWLPQARILVLAPTIDPFSAKNLPLDAANVRAILGAVDLVAANGGRPAGAPFFVRDDGSVGQVEHRAVVLRTGKPPTVDCPLVVQVSRWDRMKDPIGVLEGFACCLAESHHHAELVLAGPEIRGVADDPEGPMVFRDVARAWQQLPDPIRRRVHLAQLPMTDSEENASIVNALQRHAAVVVQKSLQEGFGLTVTEAMWKRRPVVASAVGGIRDQIQDGIDGLLLRRPSDLHELGDTLRRVLEDPALAQRLGEAGYRRVRDRSLSIASLENWGALLKSLLEPNIVRLNPAPVSSSAVLSP